MIAPRTDGKVADLWSVTMPLYCFFDTISYCISYYLYQGGVGNFRYFLTLEETCEGTRCFKSLDPTVIDTRDMNVSSICLESIMKKLSAVLRLHVSSWIGKILHRFHLIFILQPVEDQ